MEYTISQMDDGTWQLFRAGVPLGDAHVTHGQALDALGSELAAGAVAAAELAMEAEAGLLPESWDSPVMCLTAATGPSRDFSEVTWSALDPGAVFVPLMLSTTNEGGGHYGARLAGYFTSIALGATPSGSGRFFDSEAGREFRDILQAAGRYAVSVDPTENVEYEFQCTEQDDDGFCTAERIVFTAYEIGGMTGVPFAGFSGSDGVGAYIQLAGAAPVEDTPAEDGTEDAPAEDDTEDAPAGAVAAAGGPCCDACATRADALTHGVVHGLNDRRPRITSAARAAVVAAGGGIGAPPSDWFLDPGFDRLEPLTITDDGEVWLHLAPWGQCHTGSQPGDCTMTPRSLASYAYFRTGYVVTAEGDEIPTGRLTLGGGHADLRLSYRGATEHYDNAGAAIADLAVGEDAYGIWGHGALRPGVTDDQIRAARASSPSGDWRPVGAGLELVAALCVNQPGFPIARVASGGRIGALVAAGALTMATVADSPGDERIARLEAQLRELSAVVTAPARQRLSSLARESLRQRLVAR